MRHSCLLMRKVQKKKFKESYGGINFKGDLRSGGVNNILPNANDMKSGQVTASKQI